ncbi:MAG: RagB/SusD family nutrient uptake outer membrane protein [Fermentimonas sp.]|nr:RagB/SusD family nutrient uptake outer membrane protein [Fermentimonas sp.]
MKKFILYTSLIVSLVVILSSCNDFLEEEPKTFLSPDFYFTSEAQLVAAVNGVYTYLDDIFISQIEIGSQTYLFLELLSGYADRPYSGSWIGLSQAISLDVKEDNSYLQIYWQSHYTAIENCNSILENFDKMTPEIISESKKNMLFGEVYFLRAFNYFNQVRMFGEIPLKVTSTKSLSDVVSELSSIDAVYAQIESDLLKADSLMVNGPWASGEGRVARGAVKSLLAKVYLTMAGYPLQKGNEYNQKAYDQAKAVVQSKQFYLFDNYADLREPSNENSGEYIFMIQRESQYAGSPTHFNTLPYPGPATPISAIGSMGGGMGPALSFYGSYPEGDLRLEEKAYYYTKHETLDNPDVIVEFGRPYIYKFWDQAAAETGNSGRNYSLIRYADVLLVLAEAKARLDGGTTSDAAAIDAYYEVRSRALPDEGKPASISVDNILKERYWELCFEGQTWYDLIRTRKAFNVTTGNIVDMVGYNAPGHPEGRPFKESDLLFPYPLREKRLNPNLTR